ncbi:MAG: transcriptional regulator [Proteobacteria bacterium]|nr:transcriptional regulator [Pseudomonadota bacterium]
MEMTRVKLVTIIAESVLEDGLVREIRKAGATGFTRSDVRGEGSRGRRVGDVEGANVRLECLVSTETADRITEAVATRYFENYAIVVYVEDVTVVRGDKYV